VARIAVADRRAARQVLARPAHIAPTVELGARKNTHRDPRAAHGGYRVDAEGARLEDLGVGRLTEGGTRDVTRGRSRSGTGWALLRLRKRRGPST
jgi:hypothetical protein